jgi:hypothetical protein
MHDLYFYDVFSSLDHIASDDRKLNNDGLEGMWKWSWPHLRYYAGICLERLRKTTKKLGQNSSCQK